MTFAVPSDLATNDVFPESWADQVRTNFSVMSTWASWAITVTQSGAVTHTDTIANYIRLADLVIAQFYVDMTGAGTGNNPITLSLPVTASAAGFLGGAATVTDATGPTVYPAIVEVGSTTTMQFVKAHEGSSGLKIGQDPNFALASGDIVRGFVIYRAA